METPIPEPEMMNNGLRPKRSTAKAAEMAATIF
jgi:hypothetical protein